MTASYRNGHSRRLERALWAAQSVLGTAFVGAGAFKLFGPMKQVEDKLGFPKDVGPKVTRFIGASELAGGLGVVAPSLTRIAPALTPLAALGLDAVMILATGYHLRKRELASLPVTLGLGALAAFVAWGRYKKARIAPR